MAAFGIRHGRDNVSRLVQHEIGVLLGSLQDLTVHANFITPRLNLDTHLAHDVPIHADSTRADQRFCLAAGANAGGCDRFVQPYALTRAVRLRWSPLGRALPFR